MPKFQRNLLGAAAGIVFLAGSAAAQLLPSAGLPSVSLPAPIANVPLAGPLVNSVVSQSQAQHVIRPTLDTVAGLPEQIAESGAPSLLELRRLRLEALIQSDDAVLESGEARPERAARSAAGALYHLLRPRKTDAPHLLFRERS